MSANKRLEGKTAILTASTEGIGFAIAKRLAEEGAFVVVSSRTQTKVEKAVKELKDNGLNADGVVCHAAKEEDRRKLIDLALRKTGGIDIVVCNAGVNPHVGNFLDTTEEHWKKILDVNLISAFQLSKEVIPHLEERGGGVILYLCTIGAFNHVETLGAYCVSKTALLALTKVMASTCAPMKIRVNSICPGLIKTKFTEFFWKYPAASPLYQIPLGRMGRPEDCAGIAAFLCSDDASYITGENIPVAGGVLSRL